MTDFNTGDKVLVTSLDATRESGCGVNSRMAVGQELVVTEKTNTTVPNALFMDNGCWYMATDLELVVEQITVETPVKPTLSYEDVSFGDVVRIISLANSDADFGPFHYSEGDTFTVEDMDDDGTVQDDRDYDWFYLSDLELVDEEAERKAELEEELDQLLAEPVAEREINFLLTKDSVTLTIDGDTETAAKDHQNFTVIRQHVLDEEYDEAMSLMNISVGIANWGQGSLQIQDGKILYTGMELTGKLVDRIIEQMIGGDTEFERFAKFLNLTMEQESFKTRGRLMDFAAADKLDINEDGYVVAFKNVREDYMDKHSRKFRNMIGDAPSMRRSDVNDDHDVTCSAGLHVCSPQYLAGFWGTSGRTMRVVVDPRDFVAIPYDYNDTKARVCKYTVVEDVSNNIKDYIK